MRIITDIHLHSRYSRACSQALTLPNIAHACEKKGIDLVGTADVTHPAWRKHIGEELEHLGDGAYALTENRSKTRFLLTTELSCIYKRGGKTRRLHHVIVFPNLETVDVLIEALEKRGCNLKADGRPILGLDSEELLRILLEIDEHILLIPAHAWTPWFAIFGSQSGFDSIEECFGDLSPHIHAIETGLSSDPPMNHLLTALDNILLVSNSDAHSLDKLGREANVFEMEKPSFSEFREIIVSRDQKRFIETIEFFPEEGKYHTDGHRDCGFFCDPIETKRLKGVCPKCGKGLTIGVLNRVHALADRTEDQIPNNAFIPHRYIIPLAELISSIVGVGPSSKKVRTIYDQLLTSDLSEFSILLDAKRDQLSAYAPPEIIEGILAMREGNVIRKPGYDGEYGVISVDIKKESQKTLF